MVKILRERGMDIRVRDCGKRERWGRGSSSEIVGRGKGGGGEGRGGSNSSDMYVTLKWGQHIVTNYYTTAVTTPLTPCTTTTTNEAGYLVLRHCGEVLRGCGVMTSIIINMVWCRNDVVSQCGELCNGIE